MSMIWAPPITVRIKLEWPGQSTNVHCTLLEPTSVLRQVQVTG